MSSSIRIARKCFEICERFRSILLLTAEECVQSRIPMIRSVWFSDTHDVKAQTCDTEYTMAAKIVRPPNEIFFLLRWLREERN